MKGVYSIINKINLKKYIGSTTESFIKRWNLHKWELRNNKHKNSHLQYAWNKYKEENFEFIILEELESNILEREQYYIDKEDFENLYNINLFATGGSQFSKESIEKRRQTMLKKYASGELDHIKEINRNKEPWNKGKKYISTDHLKVPKINKGSRENFKENKRINLPEIEVYDTNNNLLGCWRSSKDLEEWSLTDHNNLPIISRFKSEHKGKPIKLLQSVNINKAVKTQKTYKGLIFKYKLRPSIE